MTKHGTDDWIQVGRFWHNTKTRQTMPVLQGGALPATDTFTGTDGTDLVVYSANWTYNGGVYAIQTNAVRPVSGADGLAHWNADTFNNDQYAQGTIVAITGAVYLGVAVRVASGATVTGYYFQSDSADAAYLNKSVGGTQSTLTYSTTRFAVNDVVRVEANGDQISAKRNGAAYPGITTQTDTAITSGYAGLSNGGGITSARLDDWEGGNLGGVTKSLTDTGTGIDRLTIAASLGITESALGRDFLGLSATLLIPDTGLGTDEISILQSLFKTITDIATALDSTVIQAISYITDAITGQDTLTIQAQFILSDVAVGNDLLSLIASLSTSDTGAGSDEIVVSVAIIGSTVWGQITGVAETNIRTFAGNWTGTGQAEGSGDSERLRLCTGDYMISEVVETGIIEVTLLQNYYSSGDTVLLQYRHGATEADCLSAGWNTYTIPFVSLGFVQVRVEATV